jgi:dsDNA-binding SOS-regulon protein
MSWHVDTSSSRKRGARRRSARTRSRGARTLAGSRWPTARPRLSTRGAGRASGGDLGHCGERAADGRRVRPWLAEQGEWLRASWEGRKLSWYAEEKRRAGSFAAFVGLRLEARGRVMRWDAVALGDSCLVQTRGGRVETAMPVSTHEEFNSRRRSCPSNETVREVALARLVSARGEAERGDLFLLMSDALSAWYFESLVETDGRAAEFDSLLAASENESLAELVRGERESKRMKDDDVAVVRVN